MLKPIIFFFELIYYSVIGFANVFKRFILSIAGLYGILSIFEKIYILFCLGTAFLLTQGWRSYQITFGPNAGENHQIYTDDFLWFTVFLFISLLPSLLIVFKITIKNLWMFLYGFRFSGLSGMTILYYLNFIDPHRIAPVEKADFTWQFYSISACLLLSWISGFLGLKNQAQKS